MVLGLGSALVGGFLLVCGVPFYSHKLYKVGGAFLVASGNKNKHLCVRECSRSFCVELTVLAAERVAAQTQVEAQTQGRGSNSGLRLKLRVVAQT